MSAAPRRERVIVKVLCLGAANAGKTSLIERYVSNSFSGRRQATVGADFRTRVLDLEDRDVVLQIWDTAGQERFQSSGLGSTYYRNADGALLVYDCSSERSVEQLALWREEALSRVMPGQAFPLVVIANKCDLRSSISDCMHIIKGVMEWSNDLHIPHLECSAKDGDGVEASMLGIASLALEAKRNRPKVDEAIRPSFVLGAGGDRDLQDMFQPEEKSQCGGKACT